jgi:hypothetical protein
LHWSRAHVPGTTPSIPRKVKGDSCFQELQAAKLRRDVDRMTKNHGREFTIDQLDQLRVHGKKGYLDERVVQMFPAARAVV